jgi:Sulfotransferase domain
MALQLIGAGLGRTGTSSLKTALERLLGGRCYHMYELRERPEDVARWERALAGSDQEWGAIFAGYEATVDWPAASFWPELAAAYPQAPVLLSRRESAESWWASMEKTIVAVLGEPPPEDDPRLARQRRMTRAILAERLDERWWERERAIAAYERHNERVRSEVPAGRLIEWTPGDGWAPLCAGLGVAEPETPFPHLNTTREFREIVGLDEPEQG